jgi:hypothetical protein
LLDENLVALSGDLQPPVLVHIFGGHFSRSKHALCERCASTRKTCVDTNGYGLGYGAGHSGSEEARGDDCEKYRSHFLPPILLGQKSVIGYVCQHLT